MKMKCPVVAIVLAVGAACVTLVATESRAALIVGQQQFNSGNVLPSPIIAVSGDLLETSVASFTGENPNTNVRNGTTGTATENTPTNPAQIWGQGTTTYNLDISTNTGGYAINEIRLFSGWGDGRAAQSYRIFYSTVGNASFTQLDGDVAVNQAAGSLLTRTYDDGGTAFITNVDAIRFVFYDGPATYDGIETVYREFDLLGVPAPEPSVIVMLLGLGGAGLLGYLWRRRRS